MVAQLNVEILEQFNVGHCQFVSLAHHQGKSGVAGVLVGVGWFRSGVEWGQGLGMELRRLLKFSAVSGSTATHATIPRSTATRVNLTATRVTIPRGSALLI